MKTASLVLMLYDTAIFAMIWITTAFAGAGAGWCGRVLLARLPRGTVVDPPWCELTVSAMWACCAARLTMGERGGVWALIALVLAWFVVLLVVCDLRCRRLPNALTLSAYPVLGAMLAGVAWWQGQPGMLERALLGTILLGCCHGLVRLVAPHAMGAGDVKLAGPVGAVLAAISWPALLFGVLGAAALAAVVASYRLLRRRGRSDLPYGPALLIPTWLLAVTA